MFKILLTCSFTCLILANPLQIRATEQGDQRIGLGFFAGLNVVVNDPKGIPLYQEPGTIHDVLRYDENGSTIVACDQQIFYKLLKPERLKLVATLPKGKEVHLLYMAKFQRSGCFYLAVNGIKVLGWLRNGDVVLSQKNTGHIEWLLKKE